MEWQDGYGGDTKYHPWRYPGNAPVKDACGVTAGGRQPLGQLDPPPGFSTGYEGKALPKLLEKTEWVAGTTVEAPWKHTDPAYGSCIRILTALTLALLDFTISAYDAYG